MFCKLSLSALLLLWSLPLGADAQGVGGPLPDFQKGAKSGVIVRREHAEMYRDLLPEPVVDLIASGELSFEAALNPRTDGLFRQWYGDAPPQPILNDDGGVTLAQGQGLPQLFSLPIGALPSASTSPNDVAAVSRKILWNANAWLWSKQSISHRLLLSVFPGPKNRPKQLEFGWERIYPQTLGPVPGTISPLFREKVSAKAPKILEGLTYLTLRFIGGEEDRVWSASPVTQRVRQLTGSNRSDVLFGGAFSLDDLMVWSGKVEDVDPKIVSRREFLVPIVDLPPTLGGGQPNGCSSLQLDGAAQIALNSQSRRFPEAAGWVPSNVLFVKRPLYRVEVASKDPFSLDARQVLYIDAGTFVPIYKVSWDAQGRVRRLVMGVLRAVAQPNGGSASVVVGEALVDLVGQGRSFVMSRNIEVCSAYTPGRELRNFDPSAIVTTPPKGAVQEKPEEKGSERANKDGVTHPAPHNEAEGEGDERATLD